MINLQKKITITLVTGLMLAGCGGGGDSDSSGNNYAPKTAAEFEAKFKDKIITLPSGNTTTIRADAKSDHVINSVALKVSEAKGASYDYAYASKNTSTSKHIITDTNDSNKKITCNYAWAFSSELSGTVAENCAGGAYEIDTVNTVANGGFTISGKN